MTNITTTLTLYMCHYRLDGVYCSDYEEVKSRINDVGKVLGGMKVFSCRVMRMNVKRRLYEGVAVPTVLYGLKHGVWQ